jgi:hypothetical protein
VSVDIGVLLIAATGFFFVLAACLVILVISLKTKETTDAIAAELRTIRRDLDQLTTGTR